MQTSPDATPSHVTALSRNRTSLPWSVLVFPAVVVPCSALGSSVLVGGTLTLLGVPAIIAFALPVGLHGGAVFAAWEGVRTDDERLLLFHCRVTVIIAVVMALLGVIVVDQGFSDPTLFLMFPTSFAAGPGVLAGLVNLSRSRFKTATGQAGPERSHP